MKNLIETFINGNLTDAKHKATRYSRGKLREGFIEYAGYSFEKSQRAVDFLKDGGSFQAYCDTV
jgi:hypothetical protein